MCVVCVSLVLGGSYHRCRGASGPSGTREPAGAACRMPACNDNNNANNSYIYIYIYTCVCIYIYICYCYYCHYVIENSNSVLDWWPPHCAVRSLVCNLGRGRREAGLSSNDRWKSLEKSLPKQRATSENQRTSTKQHTSQHPRRTFEKHARKLPEKQEQLATSAG